MEFIYVCSHFSNTLTSSDIIETSTTILNYKSYLDRLSLLAHSIMKNYISNIIIDKFCYLQFFISFRITYIQMLVYLLE